MMLMNADRSHRNIYVSCRTTTVSLCFVEDPSVQWQGGECFELPAVPGEEKSRGPRARELLCGGHAD